MNIFTQKIFKEFEADLYRCLNISFDEYLRMFEDHGNDKLSEFQKILEKEGVSPLRSNMHRSINALSCIYQERELGRALSEEEIFENAKKLGLDI